MVFFAPLIVQCGVPTCAINVTDDENDCLLVGTDLGALELFDPKIGSCESSWTKSDAGFVGICNAGRKFGGFFAGNRLGELFHVRVEERQLVVSLIGVNDGGDLSFLPPCLLKEDDTGSQLVLPSNHGDTLVFGLVNREKGIWSFTVKNNRKNTLDHDFDVKIGESIVYEQKNGVSEVLEHSFPAPAPAPAPAPVFSLKGAPTCICSTNNGCLVATDLSEIAFLDQNGQIIKVAKFGVEGVLAINFNNETQIGVLTDHRGRILVFNNDLEIIYSFTTPDHAPITSICHFNAVFVLGSLNGKIYSLKNNQISSICNLGSSVRALLVVNASILGLVADGVIHAIKM